MTRVDFYHLERSSLDQVLPVLSEKAYSTKKRIMILLGTEERVEFVNSLLWTYKEESFLPHGSKREGYVDRQPIFITSKNENLNNASILILADGATISIDELGKYERILNIFDGHDEVALNNARTFWKEIKTQGLELHYWQQNASGTFEQKM